MRAGLAAALAAAAAADPAACGFSTARMLPHMRFLRYHEAGGRLAPHVVGRCKLKPVSRAPGFSA